MTTEMTTEMTTDTTSVPTPTAATRDLVIYAWATSDVGRKRSHNEDRYLVAHDVGLFAVADGMGGHQGGEVASALAVQTLDSHIRHHRARLTSSADGGFESVGALLIESLQRANTAIRAAGVEDPTLRGMGTTTTSILFVGGRALVAHVGDSRAYLVRRGRISQLSQDHSLVAQQLRAGAITDEQARTSPYKNIITRAVGVDDTVTVDLVAVDVLDGDTFVLCSDGLSGLVTDDEIGAVTTGNFLHRVPDTLVDLANERGGSDNITVVVCHVVAVPAGG
jgi:serine/threonine protein phosphatase PrpC